MRLLVLQVTCTAHSKYWLCEQESYTLASLFGSSVSLGPTRHGHPGPRGHKVAALLPSALPETARGAPCMDLAEEAV